MTLKKLICLALVLSLALTALTGCRRKAAEDAAPETTAEANFNPDGPGYSITDGSAQTNSVPDAPVELTPQQRAAMSVGESEGEQTVPVDVPLYDDEELLPPGGDLAAEQEAQAAETAGDGDVVLGTYDENADTAQHEAPSAIDTNAYQYAQVEDENIDFTFNYPSHWQLVPGIYTVCYREEVTDGDFPARLAITRKKLVHTPDTRALLEELTSYMKMVGKQYDKETFQTSVPNHEDTFMGRPALSNTYLAYWGDVEVKGFVIGCAVQRTMYVLHFCASYADYTAMESMLNYIVQSVRLKETDQ